MSKILIINGPNLNKLGTREPSKYGKKNIDDLKKLCVDSCVKNKLELIFFQSNSEAELINKIHEANNKAAAILINAAAFTHTSVAIRDALSLFKKPSIELHISNIHRREEFRQKSLISDVVTGIICGLGTSGYILAINSIYEMIQNGNR